MSDERTTKWASLQDLDTGVHYEILNAANEEAMKYAFAAPNWLLEMCTSTSGMYGSWYVKISPNTTVKDLRVFTELPIGVGGDLADAFLNFTKRMKNFNEKHGFSHD